jgi:fluoride exporter
MSAAILVFIGAGIGGVLRYGAVTLATRLIGFGFPWGTLAVNIVGSFLMGLLAEWLAHRIGAAWHEPARLFLATGVLGGFTTFSAFSLDAVSLWQRGDLGLAAGYVSASVLLSILALGAGLGLVRSIVS